MNVGCWNKRQKGLECWVLNYEILFFYHELHELTRILFCRINSFLFIIILLVVGVSNVISETTNGPTSDSNYGSQNKDTEYLRYTIPAQSVESEVSLTEDDSWCSRKAEYWLDGEKVGEKRWWKNGKLSDICPMENGKRHGIWKWYRGDGVTLLSEHAYKDGKKHGFSRGYYGKGQLFSESYYEHGVLIREAKEWHKDGASVKEIPLHKTIVISIFILSFVFGFLVPKYWWIVGLIAVFFLPLWVLYEMIRHSDFGNVWPILLTAYTIPNIPSFFAAWLGFSARKWFDKLMAKPQAPKSSIM